MGRHPHSQVALEVEAEFHGFAPRRDVMGAAEGGKEVVQRLFVRQIDDGESEADLVSLRFEVKHVVIADAQIKQMAGQDARRIVVVIFRARRRNLQKG